jgi:serine/threonine protein kinase
MKQLSGLSPYIVHLEQYWFTPDFNHAYLIMEFLPTNIEKIINKHRKENTSIPHQNVWRWLEQLAEGLDTIHGFGLIHRDLKPGNVLLTEGNDTCKITDFGVARLCGKESTDDQSTPSMSDKDPFSGEELKHKVT